MYTQELDDIYLSDEDYLNKHKEEFDNLFDGVDFLPYKRKECECSNCMECFGMSWKDFY